MPELTSNPGAIIKQFSGLKGSVCLATSSYKSLEAKPKPPRYFSANSLVKIFSEKVLVVKFT